MVTATRWLLLPLAVSLVLYVAGAALSETLSGETVRLHEGEVVSSSVPTLTNDAGMVRVERSMVGGLAPGQSTAMSGLRLDGGVVAVPEPSAGVQGVVAMLGLGLLAAWRGSRATGRTRGSHWGAGSNGHSWGEGVSR